MIVNLPVPERAILGFRHDGGRGKVLAVVDDRHSGHATAGQTWPAVIIEEMTPTRARSAAADLIRRADELDPDSFVPVVYHLTVEQVEDLADAVSWAAREAREIRVMFDGGLKVDVGDGAGWTLPYGKVADNGR